MSQRRSAGLALVAMCLQLLAPTTTLAAVDTTGVKPGDDALTCPQLLAEGRASQAAAEAATDDMETTDISASARTRALAAATTVLGTVLPMAGGDINPGAAAAVASTSNAWAASRGQDIEDGLNAIGDRFDAASARRDHLFALYRSKCVGASSGASPAPSAAVAGPPITGARSAPSGSAADCAALDAEIAQLYVRMNAGVATATSLASSHDPRKAAAPARRAAQAANLATVLMPGLGGLVSSAASAATSAAQKAQHEALRSQIGAIADEQAQVAVRLGTLESQREAACQR